MFQYAREIRPREVKGREDAEENPGQERQSGSGAHHPQIERDCRDARHAVRHRRAEHLNGPPRDNDRARGTGNGQHQAFGQELAHETPTAGAERGPDTCIALLRAGAGEQQARDVGARDEQHDADRAEQHQHPRPDAGAHDVIDERPDANPAVLVPDGVRLLDRIGHRAHLRFRLTERHVGLQSRNHLQIPDAHAEIADPLVGWDDIRHPDVGRAGGADGVGKSRRHHPDDLVAAVVGARAAFEVLEWDRPADDLRVCAKTAAPEPIAEDRHAVAALELMFSGERPAECGSNAQHAEELRGDALRHERLGFGARLAEREPAARDRCHGLEHLLLFGPVAKVLRCDRGERFGIGIGTCRLARALANGNEPIVLVEGQAAQDHRIHHRKDRGRGADAEGEDDEGRDGEPLR